MTIQDTIFVKPWHEQETIENPFLVPTPKPYAPCQPVDEETKERLLTKAAALWEALRLLNIPAMEAYQKGYTLNIATREALEYRAVHAQRYDICHFIRKHLS